MKILSLFNYARKIHRILVILIVVLGFIIMITGEALNYPGLYFWLDIIQARQLHGAVSTFFSITLLIMIITGTLLYVQPKVMKMIRKKAENE